MCLQVWPACFSSTPTSPDDRFCNVSAVTHSLRKDHAWTQTDCCRCTYVSTKAAFAENLGAEEWLASAHQCSLSGARERRCRIRAHPCSLCTALSSLKPPGHPASRPCAAVWQRRVAAVRTATIAVRKDPPPRRGLEKRELLAAFREAKTRPFQPLT